MADTVISVPQKRLLVGFGQVGGTVAIIKLRNPLQNPEAETAKAEPQVFTIHD
jgi:hypothetical protein